MIKGILDSYRLLFVAFLLYPVGATLILKLRSSRRWPVFAIYNLVTAFLASGAAVLGSLPTSRGSLVTFVQGGLPLFIAYFGIVGVAYLLLRRGASSLAAFWFPLVCLILLKYLPFADGPFQSWLSKLGQHHIAVAFVGISYVSFRLSLVASEVQNGLVELPSFSQYLAYAFFVPLLSVGPISPYSKFFTSIEKNRGRAFQKVTATQRILLGLVKYTLFAGILGLLTYSGLMRDGHPHAKIDLILSVLTYPLFLYCNFSGLCDVVIGVSALLGIEVIENFDQPFLSRNFQEFWSRWHISLSAWFRDMMFTPLVKTLTRRFGAKNINHTIAATIMSVFVVIGVWHGAGLNYLLFGISQGLGVVAVHYSTIYMKKRLGKVGFQKYRARTDFRILGMAATYLYFALTMILFANTLEQISDLFKTLV